MPPPRDQTARAAEFNSTNDYTGSSKNVIGGANVSYVKYDYASNSITNYNEPIATANGVRVALEGGTTMKTPVFLTPLMNLFGSATAGGATPGAPPARTCCSRATSATPPPRSGAGRSR